MGPMLPLAAQRHQFRRGTAREHQSVVRILGGHGLNRTLSRLPYPSVDALCRISTGQYCRRRQCLNIDQTGIVSQLLAHKIYPWDDVAALVAAVRRNDVDGDRSPRINNTQRPLVFVPSAKHRKPSVSPQRFWRLVGIGEPGA